MNVETTFIFLFVTWWLLFLSTLIILSVSISSTRKNLWNEIHRTDDRLERRMDRLEKRQDEIRDR